MLKIDLEYLQIEAPAWLQKDRNDTAAAPKYSQVLLSYQSESKSLLTNKETGTTIPYEEAKTH